MDARALASLLVISMFGCYQTPLYELSPSVGMPESLREEETITLEENGEGIILPPGFRVVGEQEIFYLDGSEFVVSRLENTAVAVYGRKVNKNEIRLDITCRNNGEKPVNFFPKNISATGYDVENGLETRLHVYTPEEYLNVLRKRQTRNMALVAFLAGMSTAGAGETTSTTRSYTSGSIYSPETGYISGSATTTSTTTSIDYAEKAEAEARSQETIIRYSQLSEQALAGTKKDLLKTNTIFPETTIDGSTFMRIEPNAESKFRISIPLGDETHIFWFKPKFE